MALLPRRVVPLVVLGLALIGLAPALVAQGGGAAGQRLQRPARAQRPGDEPAKGTSAIRGFVVAADTGAPLRRAQVRAFSAETRDTRVTTTDDQGRFELKELLGGRYTVTASKGGFVTLQYGQRRPSEQGTPLDVAEGQALEKVGIALPRGSVIAGRIVDEFGEPVTGAIVTAMRFGYVNGTRRLMNVGGGNGGGGNDRTDDQGGFRLFGLTPGEYVVSASLRGGPMAVRDADDEATSGYAPTYYPGTPNVADAQRVSVGVGEEAAGVTFALTLTRLVHVSGRALTSQGAPAAGAMVIAMSADSRGAMSPGNSRGGAISADGTFDVPGLAPGTYVIHVRERGPRGGGEFGSTTVTVGTTDLSGVTITTGPGATASGRIVTDQGTPAPFGPREVRVMAVPAGNDISGFMGGGAPPRTNDDYTFELRGLSDTRVLRVTAPSGWSLKSIDLDGQDVSDTPLDFRSGDVRGLRVVLTQSVTDLSGLVADDRGQPLLDATVVIFPDDEARWTAQSRYIRTARPDQQGRYQVKGLPPDPRYLVAVVQGLEDGQANDPEFLRTLKAAARTVALAAGETKTFDVRK